MGVLDGVDTKFVRDVLNALGGITVNELQGNLQALAHRFPAVPWRQLLYLPQAAARDILTYVLLTTPPGPGSAKWWASSGSVFIGAQGVGVFSYVTLQNPTASGRLVLLIECIVSILDLQADAVMQLDTGLVGGAAAVNLRTVTADISPGSAGLLGGNSNASGALGTAFKNRAQVPVKGQASFGNGVGAIAAIGPGHDISVNPSVANNGIRAEFTWLSLDLPTTP